MVDCHVTFTFKANVTTCICFIFLFVFFLKIDHLALKTLSTVLRVLLVNKKSPHPLGMASCSLLQSQHVESAVTLT